MNLGNIAELSIGLVLSRKKAEEYETNKFEYKLISLKSVNDNGTILIEKLERFFAKEELNEEVLTRYGDVLIRLSEPYTSIFIENNFEGIVVPVNYAIIRLKEKTILPEFLKFYINSINGKRSILKVCEGSILKTISIANLKDIKVKSYSIKEQEDFINLNKLAIKEIELLNNLIAEKHKYLDSMNRKLLK